MESSTTTPEMAINMVINDLLASSHSYMALYVYFDLENIALKGFAKFFKGLSDRERELALKLMKYQNTRDGKVKLTVIPVPIANFRNTEKGDALHAMETTLDMQKRMREKLISMTRVAGRYNDLEMVRFIDREFLDEKLNVINTIAEYVTDLTTLGKGIGLWTFDQKLLSKG